MKIHPKKKVIHRTSIPFILDKKSERRRKFNPTLHVYTSAGVMKNYQSKPCTFFFGEIPQHDHTCSIKNWSAPKTAPIVWSPTSVFLIILCLTELSTRFSLLLCICWTSLLVESRTFSKDCGRSSRNVAIWLRNLQDRPLRHNRCLNFLAGTLSLQTNHLENWLPHVFLLNFGVLLSLQFLSSSSTFTYNLPKVEKNHMIYLGKRETPARDSSH